jgi:outer membrane lipoprotein carrier protein
MSACAVMCFRWRGGAFRLFQRTGRPRRCRSAWESLPLTSKAKEPEFEYAELGLDATALQRMRFKDQLGNVTEIRFADWKRNPSLPAGTFKFTPPKGVDVVGDLKPDAEVFPVRE